MPVSSDTRSVGESAMPSLHIHRLLPLLLFFFLTTPSATTQPADIHLSPINVTSAYEETRLILPASSLHLPLHLPPNTTVLIEAFYNTRPLHPHPHPLLLAAPFPPKLVLKPREAPPNLHVDFEAFHTWRRYSYLLLSNYTTLYIRLYDHHDAVQLNATLRVTLVPPDTCPRGPEGVACSSRGDCRAGECVCQSGFAGRYCEASVGALPKDDVTVPFGETLYYKYAVPVNGSVAVRMSVQHQSPRSVALIVKRAYENGGLPLKTGSPLPGLYDQHFDGSGSGRGVSPAQTVVRNELKRGDILYIAVCNIPRVFLRGRYHVLTDLFAAPVTVHLEAFPCANRKIERLRRCPASGHDSWELSLTFLLLPLLLGTLTLLTMVVCVSVWAGVFRQQIFEVIHGHAPEDNLPRRDKLSEAEVNAMFPAFTFTKGETAALGATGDVCCSVCLCSFEEGELLRRLACGHSYHSICLDRWLLTNATCPRCRKSARIHGEVGRWWLVRRHVVRVVGRVNGFLHWLVGVSQARVRESPELESIEVEGLIPNREDGVSRRYVQTS